MLKNYFGEKTSALRSPEMLDIHCEYVVLVSVVLLETVDAVLQRVKGSLLGATPDALH